MTKMYKWNVSVISEKCGGRTFRQCSKFRSAMKGKQTSGWFINGLLCMKMSGKKFDIKE